MWGSSFLQSKPKISHACANIPIDIYLSECYVFNINESYAAVKQSFPLTLHSDCMLEHGHCTVEGMWLKT